MYRGGLSRVAPRKAAEGPPFQGESRTALRTLRERGVDTSRVSLNERNQRGV